MDAAADARTAELHRLLMRPFGSRMVSVLPVHGPAGVSGALLLEDAAEPERARSFAQAVSSIAAMRMARHEQEGTMPLCPLRRRPNRIQTAAAADATRRHSARR